MYEKQSRVIIIIVSYVYYNHDYVLELLMLRACIFEVSGLDAEIGLLFITVCERYT